MNLVFAPLAWDDYLYWQANDPKTLARINLLIRGITRDSHSGIGKPEPLKHALRGWWSRRIDSERRIVYKLVDEGMFIAQLRYHY